MRALGMRFQTQLVDALERVEPQIRVHPGNLGQQIKGERTIPVEQVERWQRALQLTGEQAAEFDVAVRLTHSDEKIRELIARQDLQLAQARAAMLLYEERIELAFQVVDALNAMRLRRVAQEKSSDPPPPA